MRWLACVLLVAGCLDEPALPPGHATELRSDSLVVDLDGDSYDDLVLWGHDADPRQEADVFIMHGSSSGLGPIDIVSLAVAADPWHEVLDVTAVLDASGRPTELVALLGEDTGLPPDGQASRVAYVTHIPLVNGSPGTPTYDAAFNAQNLGGYANDPTTARILGFAGEDGPDVMIVGDTTAWLAQSGAQPQPITLPVGDDDVGAAFVLPLNVTTHHEPLLFVTNHHIYTFDGSTQVAQPVELSDSGLRTAVAHVIGDALVVASIPAQHAEVSLATYAGSTGALDVSTLQTRHQPDAVGVFDPSNDGAPEVLTLEGGLITLYGSVVDDSPMATAAYTATGETLNNQLLVVGDFGDAHPVYVFDTYSPESDPDCFAVDPSSKTLQRCP